MRSERPAIELEPWQYVEESTLMPALKLRLNRPLSATATHKTETWECFSFDYVRNNWLIDAGLPSAVRLICVGAEMSSRILGIC